MIGNHMNRSKNHYQRLNKRRIWSFFIIIAFGLLTQAIYYVLLGRVLVVGSATSRWVLESVELKYTAPFVVGYVPDAVEIIHKEQDEIRTELAAFDTFIDEIKGITPVEQPPALESQQSNAGFLTPDGSQFEEVRQAYEQTVMSVPHYEEEYDDTITESLAEEFGSEIVTQFTTGQRFSPVIKEYVIEAAQQSQQKREYFLSTLESEHETLRTAQERLEKIDAQLECLTMVPPSDISVDKLIQHHNRLIDLEETCETVLKERQQQRLDRPASVTGPRTDIADLYSYLYDSLPVTYPVLADTAELLERLQDNQRELAKELAARF
jgi:DNA repair exonuclease SbcCD ATPase subunit